MRVEKVTFELSSEVAENLRELKRNLEKKYLPVKQRDIVDHLLKNAKLAPLVKHFTEATDDRIGDEILGERERILENMVPFSILHNRRRRSSSMSGQMDPESVLRSSGTVIPPSVLFMVRIVLNLYASTMAYARNENTFEAFLEGAVPPNVCYLQGNRRHFGTIGSVPHSWEQI